MTFRILIAVSVLLVSLSTASIASADPITWTLMNGAQSFVTFTDGATATGSFIFDATTDTVVSANIVTTGCPSCTFTTGETYTTRDPGSAPFMPFSIVLVPSGTVSAGTRLLDLELSMPGLVTGTVSPVLLSTAFEGVCLDDACTSAADSPFRFVTAGQLVAPVTTPEPSTLLLMGAGLLFLVVATKRLALP
jgi:hypothetical protein